MVRGVIDPVGIGYDVAVRDRSAGIHGDSGRARCRARVGGSYELLKGELRDCSGAGQAPN